nr:RNB domain-containing ribonuclease [Planosporangium flavigriseum]
MRRELKLPDGFPAAVQEEAEQSVSEPPRPPVDRTDIPFATIDPATSLDLDQAMCLQRRSGGGYRVYYAIADVASWVRPGGAVDTEAWTRGQTVYLPDGKVPLYPKVLSEDAASLLPDRERPAVVWTTDLDADGGTVAVRVERALVRSRAKLNYERVQSDVDAGQPAEPVALLPEIGKLLIERGLARGAINLPIPDQEVERDGNGWRLVLRAPLAVEEYNAQISLLTGVTAAKIMIDGRIGLLRTMPAPRPEAVAKLRAAAPALGVVWPHGVQVGGVIATLDPADPRKAAFLDEAIELMRGAGYRAFAGQAPADAGHGAVAAPYSHVTAPLRRLADRYATEVCLALHAGAEVPEWVRQALPNLPDVMSSTDRIASAAERGAVDLVEAVLLEARVGEEFEAAVLDVDPGVVALDDPPVQARCAGDGLVAGTRVRVRLVEADPSRRKVLFHLVE